jgi:hypothetical protein
MEYWDVGNQMKSEALNYKEKMKISASKNITRTKEWAGNAKDRFLNMEISQHMEDILMNHLRLLSIITTILAFFTLFIMVQAPTYFFNCNYNWDICNDAGPYCRV